MDQRCFDRLKLPCLFAKIEGADKQGSCQPVKAAQGAANCSLVGFSVRQTVMAAVQSLVGMDLSTVMQV